MSEQQRAPNADEKTCLLIAEMRERGCTYRAIAKELGISVSAVSWQCLRMGADHPRIRNSRPDYYKRNPVVYRNGRPVRAYTPEEDRRLLALESSGSSYHRIAIEVGRQRNSVKARLMTLARHEARAER